jgi:hypothetical protein
MIGIVKLEFGMFNLYVRDVCVVSTTTMAGIKHAIKKHGLQGYTYAAG